MPKIVFPASRRETALEKIICFCLWAAAFLLPLAPAAATHLLTAAAVLALADNVIAQKFKMAVSPTFFLFVLFFALAALSLPNSPRYGESLYNFQVLAPQYFFIYWLTASYVKTRQELCCLLFSLLAAAALAASYGIYQYFCGAAFAAEWVDEAYFPTIRARAFSTFGNPNILASFLVLAAALSAGWVFAGASRAVRIGAAFLCALFLFCLLLTFSRGAWLSAAAVWFAAAVAFRRKLLYFLLPGALLLFFVQNPIIDRFMSVFPGNDTSALLRFALWESTLAMIRDHPLTGIGWGAYRFVYPNYDFFVNNPDVIIYHAHNMYLNIAAEIGLPGLAVFLLLFVRHFCLAARSLKSSAPTGQRACAIGLCLMFVGLLVGGFTDYTLFNMELSSVFWLLSAASCVLGRLSFYGESRRHYKIA